MFPPLDDVYRVAPELVLCAFGILVMLAEPFVPRERRGGLGTVALLGAVLALVATRFVATHPGTAFYGLILTDRFSIFLHLMIGAVAVLVVLGSRDYLEREGLQHGEYYALVLFAAAGMEVMASAQELMTAFIGLEMSSISSYILASFRRSAPKANESAMKYFLLGSFATAFFLYGVAMVYGATGTTKLDALREAITAGNAGGALLTLGFGMMFVGLAFKVATAPFQIWTPDVYEGAPTPVTALLSSAPKAAAFALLLRILYVAFDSSGNRWLWVIWISAALTMFVGNLAALVQTNLKRMLAYSSIAHAGYILVAVAAVSVANEDGRNEFGIAAVLFYLAAYALMKLGAFTMVTHLGGTGERRLEISDYAGLGTEQPAAAACLTLYLLSLLGLPVTAGFLGKLYVFDAALKSHLVWLAVLLAINSVIGAYYYLRVVVVMYMREPQQQWAPAPIPRALGLVLLLTAAGTIYLGLFPGAVMGFAARSALSLR
ncbi:MAG TPA: NADH-quinone oxidoreductase subunit N [Candidatus Acidoferrales bacterium]|nr:NADH-quinone oxidoreductase subunit N [Candidatus Acidoferrales bacterium]